LSRRATLYQKPVQFQEESNAHSRFLGLRRQYLHKHVSALLSAWKPLCDLRVLCPENRCYAARVRTGKISRKAAKDAKKGNS
jgi:hypothetical protein